MPFCGEPVGISSNQFVELITEAWERHGMRSLPAVPGSSRAIIVSKVGSNEADVTSG
jgi:hypothetical protein